MLSSSFANRATLDIGDVRLAVVPKGNEWDTHPYASSYLEFVSTGDPQMVLRLRDAPYKEVLPEPLFRSGGRWSVHNVGPTLAVTTYAGGLGQYQVLLHDPQTLDTSIHLQAPVFGDRPYTIDSPLMQILYVMLMGSGRGALIHGSAVEAQGRGMAFIGESGAGKSTMGQMWLDSGLGTVLCDDRILFRESGDGYRLYGTPWHGDIPSVCSSVPALDRLYLLRHDTKNRLTRLASSAVVSRLMRCVFPPWWDADGVAYTLRFLTTLVTRVPCYELGFVPSPDALHFILDDLSR